LRYSRQILLPEFDIEGQERLRQSRALIVGLGGLGSPVAMYLAAAGVGRLTLVDFDTVDLSNLQRQIIHRTADIGRPKVESARDTLLALNPLIEVTAIPKALDEAELLQQVEQADVVVDACDNLPTRLAINAACVRVGVPLVTGAAIRLEGQVLVWRPGGEGACYRCLYRDAEVNTETCAQTGVLAPVVGVIGSLQAVEAIRVLTGLGETLDGRLLLLDAARMEWRTVRVGRDPACPVCGRYRGTGDSEAKSP
jgi:adenylyltransferase/sulfurtransferase